MPSWKKGRFLRASQLALYGAGLILNPEVAHAQQPNQVGIPGVSSLDHKPLILVLKPGGTVRVSKYLIFEFVDGFVHGYFSKVC